MRGRPKYGGRQKGTENKVTQEAKELFVSIMSGQISNIKTALNEAYDNDKIAYLKCITGLLPYFIPKQTDVTSQGEQINHEPLIIDLTGNGGIPFCSWAKD